jgi:hypothetical protein
MNETTMRILTGLTELTMQDLARLESERTHPTSSPDTMDDRIKFFRDRAANLRALRTALEDEMSKVVP